MSLNSDIKLKLNKVSDKFRKGLIWCSHRVIDIFDVKELMAGMMKIGVKMEHPAVKAITYKGGMIYPVSINPGHLSHILPFCIVAKRQ